MVDPFARRGFEYGYRCQAAFYRRVAQLLGLDFDPAFVFVVVEKEPPHLVTVVEFDGEALEEGDRLNRRTIDLYPQCTATGEWPGYSAISLPYWAIHKPTIGDLVREATL